MKIFAPKYYKQFHCIASKCSHSCCIGWEIDVDQYTLEKYQNLHCEYSNEISKSINKTPTPHFKLLSNGHCAHLDENGLCKIITNLGEDYLCDICKEHPRFYNQTPFGLEVGLGLSCEEASRIILSSDNYNDFYEVEEDDSPCDEFDFNPIPKRNKILSMLQRKDLSYEEKIKSLLLDYNLLAKLENDEEFLNLLDALEYLNEDNKKLFSCYSSNASLSNDVKPYLERALAYFVYRHVTKAQSQYEIEQYLGLCLFLERLFRSIIYKCKIDTLDKIISIAITISEEIEYNEDNIEDILFQFI